MFQFRLALVSLIAASAVAVEYDTPSLMTMSWSLPSPDDRVEYNLWSVPTDAASNSFLSSFKNVAKALGDRAYFTPHMYIHNDGTRRNCEGTSGENVCYLCSNHGRYCARDPDDSLDRGISGQDVVRESLRRICIWKHYGQTDGIGEAWWSYVNEFQENCSSSDNFMNEDCVAKCYERAGVDPDNINRCMLDSGGLVNDDSNSLLDQEIVARNEATVRTLPSVFVNKKVMHGKFSPTTVFAAICAAYAKGGRPAVCDKCATSTSNSDLESCVADTSETGNDEDQSSWSASNSVNPNTGGGEGGELVTLGAFATPNSSSSSSSSSSSGFLNGLTVGLGLAVVIAVSNIVYKRRNCRNPSSESSKYRAIEMAEFSERNSYSGIELAEESPASMA
jgi:hypothetical protein